MSVAVKNIPNEQDPKQALLAKIGDLSRFEIGKNEVLLAIYRRSNTLPSGLAVPDQYTKEDIYQGKVGLVVKIGAECVFTHIDPLTGAIFGGVEAQLHDWVVVRPSDTWALDINSDPHAVSRADFYPCRLVKPHLIRARIQNPNMVW
jgi:hypothetical protein